MPWFWSLVRGRIAKSFRPPLGLEPLEDRTMPSVGPAALDFLAYAPQFAGGVNVAGGDVTGDGIVDLITGAGAGGGPHVKVFDGRTGAEVRGFFPFRPAFRGGVDVAAADLNADGYAEIVAGAGAGGRTQVKVFDGRTGAELADFLAFDPAFLGGVNVAAAAGRIVVAAGAGGGPHVKVIDFARVGERRPDGVIAESALLANVFAFHPTFVGGVSVASADVTGDRTPDLITGAGAGGGPHVKVFDGASGREVASFFAYADTFRGGVDVAAADYTGDGRADVVTGAGPGGGPHVKVIDATALRRTLPDGLISNDALLDNQFSYAVAFRGGASVAAGDVTGDGVPDLMTGAGPGGGPHVRVFGRAPVAGPPPFLPPVPPGPPAPPVPPGLPVPPVPPVPPPLPVGNFPADLSGWQPVVVGGATGGVDVTDGILTLREGDSFSVRVSTAFTVPATPTAVRITYERPAFDVASVGRIKDAFEVSVVGADGAPLALPFAPDRDASFNWTEQLDPAASADTDNTFGTVVGEATVNLSALPAGLAARLVLRLVNDDTDQGTTVRVRRVDFVAATTTAPAGTTPPPDRVRAATAPDLSALADVTPSARLDYGRTTLTDEKTTITTDVSVRNAGTYPLAGRLVVVIGNLSDPSVGVLDPDGYTADGRPFFDFTPELIGTALLPGRTSAARALRFTNPSRERFTFDTQVLAGLDRDPVFTTEPVTLVQAGRAYQYPARATDADGQALAFALVGGPAGMTVNPTTGDLNWPTTAGDLGNHAVRLRVSDPLGGTAEQAFTVGVRTDIPNRPPVITSNPPTDATVAGAWEVNTLKTGSGTTGVVVADFGTGRRSLVSVNAGDQTLTVHSGTSGTPTTQRVGEPVPNGRLFRTGLEVNVGLPRTVPGTDTQSLTGFAQGDVNGDGTPDLVTAAFTQVFNSATPGGYTYSHFVSVAVSHADGSFADPLVLPVYAGGDANQTNFGVGSVTMKDFDGDGKADILALYTNAAEGTTSGPNQLLFWKGTGSGTFAAVQASDTGTYLASFQASDLNADGKLDLIGIRTSYSQAGVLFGNGNGTFGTYTEFASVPGAGFYNPFAVGDVDAANGADVVLSAYFNQQLLVYRNDGTGTLTPSATLNTNVTGGNGQPFAVSVGDFSGDGKADVVFAARSGGNSGGAVGIFRGTGDGVNFTYADANPGGFMAQTPYQFTAQPPADLNGDGALDFVLGHADGIRGIEVGLNRGDGTFAFTTYQVAGDSSGTAANSGIEHGVLVGDYNRDGMLDLATYLSRDRSFEPRATITVMFADAPGVFASPVAVKANGVTPFVAPALTLVGDLNNDGNPDLLTADNDLWYTALGHGDGTFDTPLPASQHLNPPTDGFLTDLNQDGNLDVVWTGGRYFADEGGYGAALGNGDGTFTRTYRQGAGNFYGASVISAGDFNGDGLTDFAAFHPAVYAPGTGTFIDGFYDVFLYQPSAPGTFARSFHHVIPVSAADDDFNRRSFTTGDFDGDGVLDLVSIFPQVTATPMQLLFFKGHGDGTFAAPTGTPVFATNADSQFPKWLAAGDLNGDGTLDLVTTSAANRLAVLKGNGDGTFGTPTEYIGGVTFTTGRQLHLTDIDGDGHLDFVGIDNRYGVSGQHVIAVRHGRGDGTFAAEELYTSPGTINSLGVGDVDRDGVPDVVAATAMYGGGSGILFTGVKPGLTAVSTGDVTGDGKADAVATNFANNRVKVLAGHGDDTFTRQPDILVGRGPVAVAALDFNADGKLDLVTANRSGRSVTLLRGTGGGGFTRTDIAVGDSPVSLAVGDLTGDGKPDLLVADDGTSAAHLLANTGSGFAAPVAIPLGEKPNAVTIADVTGDGVGDIAVSLTGSRRVMTLPGNGNGTFAPPVYVGLASAAGGITAADFNLDGKTDLAVSLPADGTVALLFARGSGLFTRPQVVRVGDQPTAITVQDVDGDGRVDLLVANAGDGTASVILNKFDLTKLYRATATAFDPDGDQLTFDLPTAPGGMVINTTTGEIVWAPTADQLGPNPVTIRVSDGRGGTATQAFGIAVSPTRTNNAPVFTSAPNPVLVSSAAFTYTAKAADTDGDTLRYRLVSGPAGATIDPLTGVATWDPRNPALRMNTGVNTADNGHVLIPDAPSLRPASLTAEGWFRFDNTTRNQVLVSKRGPNGDFFYPYSFALRYQYGLLRAQVGGQDALGNNVNGSADLAWTPTAGRWYHLAMTFDDATGGVTLMADGRVVATQTMNGRIIYDSSPVRIGVYENGSDGLIGAASNVRLWGVARTEADIQSTITSDVAPNAPGLLADLRFRDGDAMTLRDSSVNGNNGRRAGSPNPVPAPGMADPQTQSFTVRVEDGKGGFDLQTFTVNVVSPVGSAITGTVSQSGGGTLAGWVVFVDANGNGLRDGSEASATTAANGTYTLPNLLPGDSRLSVESRAGFVTPAARTVTVAPFADVVADFAVSPQPLGQIRGTLTVAGRTVPGWVLFHDANGNTVRDDGETTTTTDALGGYAFSGLSAGTYAVRFDAPSGWKATAPTNGHTVALAANDTNTGHDFTVAPVDAAGGSRPRFVSTPGTAVVARTTFRYAAVAIDPAARPLTYSLALAPAGMAVDPISGQMAWTPTLAQVGPQQVIVKVVNDDAGLDLQAFTVTVSSPNTAPIFSPTLPTAALVGVPYRFDVRAQDPEQASLTFAFDTAPAGASIDPNTGRITWTPTVGQLGPQAFAVVVNDGAGGDARQSFNVSVSAAGVNTAPTVTALPRLTARATFPYSGRISATDANGDPLTFTLNSGPTGLSLSSGGLISWTPTADQLGAHAVSVGVSDGRGGTDARTFEITVGNSLPNAAPVVTSTPPAVALADGLFAYTLTTADADGDPVAFQLLAAPAGMSLDTVRGTLRWQPARDQLGPATVSVRAYDPFGGETTQTFTVTVRGADGPPVITSVPPTEAVVGTAFLYSVRATDLEGDPLTFALLTAPEGMTLHPVTGELSWTPTAGQVGTPAVIVQVSDGRGGFTTQGFAVRVLAGMPNRPPTFDTAPPLFASVGSPYSFTATAADPDGQPVRYELRTGPTGMSVDAGTGEIRWTPAAGQEGTRVVTVAAFDSGGAAGLLSFELSVLAANSVPTITGTAPTFAIAGGTYRYDVTATDLNFDPLAYTLLNAPAGMTVDSFGRITWTTTPADIGPHTATVRVTDPRGGQTEQTFAVTVRADTSAPRVVVIPGRNVVRATDNDTSARFNLTPDNPSNLVRVAATDDVGVVGLTVVANGKAVVPDERGLLTFHYQEWGFGSVRVVATATDAAGNSGTGSKAFAFAPYGFDPDGDTRDPSTLGNATAVITSPTVGEQTGGFVSVRGSATSDDFTGYTLSFRRADQDTYTTIAAGTSKVADGVLGKWDTSLLENDEYVLRLEEADDIFGTTVHEVSVGVSGNLKLGNFRLSFADLTIPVAGIPITLARTFDTLRADRDGDLGYGWRLEYRNTNLQVGLPKSGLEDIGIYTAFKPGTKVYLTLPGGERQGFTFTPDLRALPSFGGQPLVVATPRFTPDRGVTSTLSVGSGSVILNPFNELTTLGGMPWNPAAPDFGGGYTLTTADGTRFFIDGTSGLMQTATDRNANRLTFGEGGITSNNGGVGVTFDRDAKGRIVAVTDPAGNAVRYAYDLRGDLASVTDRVGNVTRFNYRTDRPHYLDSVIDPLGRTGARAEYDAAGRLIRTTGASGEAMTLAYDPDNQVVTARDTLGRTLTSVYDAAGNVVATTDAAGNTTRSAYDDRNNEVSSTNALGETTATSYDAAGRVLTNRDPAGHTSRYTYGVNGAVASETDALGRSTAYTLDSAGNAVAVTDPLGRVTRSTFTAAGQAASVTDPLGHTTAFAYTAAGFLAGETNPLGGTATYATTPTGVRTETVRTVTVAGQPVTVRVSATFDAAGRRLTATDPTGGTARTAYDALGRPVSDADPLGRVTTTAYSAGGQVATTTYPDGTTQQVTRDAADQPTTVIGRAGGVTSVTVDALGRVTRTEQAGGPSKGLEYDALGRLTARLNELGERTEMTFAAPGFGPTATRDALGRQSTGEYDAVGRLVATADPAGRTTRYEYDAADNLTAVVHPDGSRTTGTYDPLDRLTEWADEQGRRTRYEYDALTRLTAVTDPAGGRTAYSYDELGALTGIRDPLGAWTRFSYDPAGRLVGTRLPLGQTASWQYDSAGQLAGGTDFDGRTYAYQYDANGRLTRKTLIGGSADVTLGVNGLPDRVTDASGVAATAYDSRDRVVTRTDAGGATVSYAYDAANRVTAITTADGTVRYEYDAGGRMTAVVDPAGGRTEYEYDAAGNRAATRHPNGVTETRTYDARDRLTSLEQRTAGGVLARYSYTRAAAGQLLSADELDGRRTEYEYDAAGRLVRETVSAPGQTTRTTTYTLDAAGNRLSKVDSVAGTTTYEYDANGRLTREVAPAGTITYTHDASGNRVLRDAGPTDRTTYEWDAEGRMTAARVTTAAGTTAVGYRYDLRGQLVARTVDGVETRYLIDTSSGLAEVLREYRPDGTTVASYVYGLERLTQSRGGVTSVYLGDGETGPRVLADAAGGVQGRNTFDAFGTPLATSGPTNRALFQGELRDSLTGFDDLRSRWYDPAVGRFVSRDRAGLTNSDWTEQNRYLFAAGDPVNRFDPTGQRSLIETKVGLAVAAVLLAALPLTNLAQNVFYRSKTDWIGTIYTQGLPVPQVGGKVGKAVANLSDVSGGNAVMRAETRFDVVVPGKFDPKSKEPVKAYLNGYFALVQGGFGVGAIPVSSGNSIVSLQTPNAVGPVSSGLLTGLAWTNGGGVALGLSVSYNNFRCGLGVGYFYSVPDTVENWLKGNQVPGIPVWDGLQLAAGIDFGLWGVSVELPDEKSGYRRHRLLPNLPLLPI